MQGEGKEMARDRGGSWRVARRLGRRRVLRGAALLGAGAAFAAACGGGSDKSNGNTSGGGGPATNATTAAGSGTQAAAASQTPKSGGLMREATVTQTPHFSPFHPGADPSFVNTWRRVNGYYEPLIAYKTIKGTEQARMTMRLAASIEQPDDSTYIIKMNPSTFHNREPAMGREVTSDDMIETLKFLTKPPATGGSFLQSGKDLKSMEAVDKLTLKFTTFGPRAFFYENVPTRFPVPKEMLDEEKLKRSIPVGNGPYEYKAHTQGSTENIKRFEGYRLKPKPYIDEKQLTFMPDNVATEAAFRAGQIEAVDSETVQNVKQRDSIVKDLGAKVTPTDFPSQSGMALVVNVNRKPWDDARVREAMYRAVDVDRILNVVFFGDGVRSWYFSPANVARNALSYDQVKQYVDYDPKKATDLLKASGIDLSKEYEFMVPVENQSWVDSGRLMAEDFAKVGLKTRVNPVVRNIYLQRAGPKPGDFDITMSVFLDWQYIKTNSGTFWDSTSLQDPEVDALVDKITQTVDAKARDQLWADLQLMLAKKYSNLMPFLTANVHYIRYAYVKNINPDFGNGTASNGWQDDRWMDKA
jgi:peptide/nickel transport system substrate-binding protein